MERGSNDKQKLLGIMFWKGTLITRILLLLYSLIYVLASDYLDAFGLWLSRNLGYAGIALFSLFVDMFIMPTSVDILFPFVMGCSLLSLLLVMGAASSCGGYAGCWIVPAPSTGGGVFSVQ